MANREITIRSLCDTVDQDVHVKPGDMVRWHADHAAIYILHITGGFFKGHPDDFPILVISTNWTAYYEVAGPTGDKLSKYIYDLTGKNCEVLVGPPDIIIDSTSIKRSRKASSPKKKKAPAKAKKK